MYYFIIGSKAQMHILGNFVYINKFKPFEWLPYFNILFYEDINKDNFIIDEKNKYVSLISNFKNIKNVDDIKSIFDEFNLPYYFASKENIEQFY